MANLITILRFPLLFLYIAMLYFGTPKQILWGIPFILIIILMDSLDGIIARSRNEVSLLGSVLDIATDRALEIALWVIYAHVGLISIVIPLIVITRGTLVDGVRSVGMSKGEAPFHQVKSPISKFLVASRFMRSTYGIMKSIAFVLLSIDYALLLNQSPQSAWVHTLTLVISWVTISITILRGIPVLVEGYSWMKNPPKETGPA